MKVDATDCIKSKISGRYQDNDEKKSARALPQSERTKGEKVDVNGDPIPTKVEYKKKVNELKQRLKKVWTTDDEQNAEEPDVPSHFKKYTIQDRTLLV